MAKLTSRTLASGVTKGDLIHIVITGDTSQDPDGSSYKATIEQVSDALGGTSGGCVTDFWVSNLHGCSPITVHDSVQSYGSTASGDKSFAFGSFAVASGLYSHAEGQSTSAVGSSSHAEGNSTAANGLYSHSEGYFSVVNGDYSHVEGRGNFVEGINGAHAEGYNNVAYGDSSHVEGSTNSSITQFSHTEGNYNASGYKGFTASSVTSGVVTLSDSVDYSMVFSSANVIINNVIYPYSATTYSAPDFFIYLTNSNLTLLVAPIRVVDLNNLITPQAYESYGDSSHSEGQYTKSLGIASHTEGSSTTALGDYSHAEGISTIAVGEASHAEGKSAIASGDQSHAEGTSTTSSGSNSHAEGQSTIASGDTSHAEGYSTIAGGSYSHAEGYSTSSVGHASHSGGFNTIASGDTSFIHSTDSQVNGDRSVVIGGQNITGNTSDTVYVPSFVIYTEYEPTSSADTAGEPGSITWSSNTDSLYYKTANGWFILSGATF